MRRLVDMYRKYGRMDISCHQNAVFCTINTGPLGQSWCSALRGGSHGWCDQLWDQGKEEVERWWVLLGGWAAGDFLFNRDRNAEMIFLGFVWSFDSLIYRKRLTAVDGSGAQLSCTKTHLTVMW